MTNVSIEMKTQSREEIFPITYLENATKEIIKSVKSEFKNKETKQFYYVWDRIVAPELGPCPNP